MTSRIRPEKHTHFVHIKGIDVLRGFAALIVVFSHYIPLWNEDLSPVPVIVSSEMGYYSVQLFFVISGIVIFATLNKCNSTVHFLYLRLSRLYPAYWASLWFMALVTFWIFQKPVWWNGIIANSTMFQEFLGYIHFDNVYWSLTVELAFYLNAAWLFALQWHKKIITICSVWLILACIWKVTSTPSIGDERDILALIFVFDYAHFFVIGITLYDWVVHGKSKHKFALLSGSVLTAYIQSGFEGIVVSMVIISFVTLAVFGHLNFLVNRVTLWLGSISFSLYLIHRNLGILLLPELHDLEIGPLAAISLTVLISLVLATLLTMFIERPALVYLRFKSPWANMILRQSAESKG